MSVRPTALTSTRKPLEKCIEHFAAGQIKGPENAQALEMLELIDLWRDAAIGIENFIIRKFLTHRDFLTPVRITEKVDFGMYCRSLDDEEADHRHIYKQEPSLAKSTLTDARQRESGLWVVGEEHARDAIKHAYTFLRRARDKPGMRHSAWPLLFKKDGSLIKRAPSTSKRQHYDAVRRP